MEIRTFQEDDRAELRELFARAGEGSPVESLWGHADSEADIYLAPYIDLYPDFLFLAVSGGRLVGYLTGCPDTSSFPSEDGLLMQAVRRHRLLLRRKPLAFFGRSMTDLAGAAVRRRATARGCDDARWPAHLHITVAPEARGTGAADGLMNGWLDRLRTIGSPGCHLQTLRENTRAVRFFRRMGFTEHGPDVCVLGVRNNGEKLHQRTMVWAP
ncbi:GNAT family N-acetyltransferase [Actinomadura algeriensis]|uniref:Ribosomal protein S18 acetylase RimI-like enzyme n=1 Tax=Actinomadura algeriensis TaxID=1679523 RepID=A0ABR9K3F5_9ACTN|nr:GNAT family N-acetyltransferase [Actinomadura algeriensis]MBE1537347.1 ribosomal protein S18 acetylase RimI-like enzyme [Actinomadura algeriensis]